MDCIMKDVVALDRSGLCPFNGQKCDGTMSITWGTDYVVIPESKVCISQLHIDGQPALVEVTAADLDRLKSGEVLMFRNGRGDASFVRMAE